VHRLGSTLLTSSLVNWLNGFAVGVAAAVVVGVVICRDICCRREIELTVLVITHYELQSIVLVLIVYSNIILYVRLTLL
jgi:hypothetical protein